MTENDGACLSKAREHGRRHRGLAHRTPGLTERLGMRNHTETDIVLNLANADELFEPPEAGRPSMTCGAPVGWDDLGAAIGEPGVVRLLRLLQSQPHAKRLVIRVQQLSSADPAASLVEVEARLRRWSHAKIATSQEQERLIHRIGLRVLAACTGLLGLALLASWVLQSDGVLGPPGPLRSLASEAIVIAGWVVMWRPIELLIFDPLRPAFERRLLERVPHMTIVTEQASDGTSHPPGSPPSPSALTHTSAPTGSR